MASPFRGGSTFSNRAFDNQRKLSNLDASERADATSDYRSQKDAFDQAYRLSEQQRKANFAEQRATLAKEKFDAQSDIAERQQKLNESAAILKQKELETKIAEHQATMALMQHKLDSTADVAKQTTGMFNDMEDLRDANGFLTPSSIAKLRAKYPDAAMHANNAEALSHEVKRFDENAKLQAALPKAGYKTVNTRDANGYVISSMRVPVKPGEADDIDRPALEAQHDALVKNIGSAWNKDNATNINRLNEIKGKLGYQPVAIPGVTDVAPPAAPIIPSAAPAPVIPVADTGTPPPDANGSPGEAGPTGEAHPMEGQQVRQKSTGKTGSIVNGQFVAQE